ncbi:MAG: hypothetical protein AVDCRST_MAG73-793, partial [uncultured Thermomicrobiales bacterium]
AVAPHRPCPDGRRAVHPPRDRLRCGDEPRTVLRRAPHCRSDPPGGRHRGGGGGSRRDGTPLVGSLGCGDADALSDTDGHPPRANQL